MSLAKTCRKKKWVPSLNHRRTCWRKRRHRSEHEAQKARAALRRHSNFDHGNIGVYPCSACGGWHIGHLPDADE